MELKCFSNLNIFLFFFLLFGKTSFSQECDSDGLKCISCTDYQTCSGGIPDGATVSCKNGGVCADDKLKKCQMKLNCYALNECNEAGIFPDAMVDSNFFVCLSDGGTGFLKYEFSCKDDSFFDKSIQSCVLRSVTDPNPNSSSENPTEQNDPISSSADPNSSTSTDSTTAPTTTAPSTTALTTTSPTTTAPTTTSPTTTAPTTTSPTTTAPTTTSPTTIAPTTTAPTTSAPTTTAPSTTSPTTTSPTTIGPTPPTTSPPTVCPMAGIFPLPDNCKMYYRCSTSLKPFYYICPGSSYFNEYILKCSLIITPTCQEQILKNSTSTTTATTTTTPKPTTSTTTSTTTPEPTTTSTTTTTTTTTPEPTTTSTITTTTTTTSTTTTSTPLPFTCQTSGTFENPSDCKTYYRCSTTGKIFRYICPGNTYFNEFTKRCSLVVTPRCKNLL